MTFTKNCVLGVLLRGGPSFSGDLDDLKGGQVIYTSDNHPNHSPGDYCVVVTYGSGTSTGDRSQVTYQLGTSSAIFSRASNGTTWTNWSQVSMDIPSFYKDYANLNALILGVKGLAILNQAGKTSGSVGDFDTFGTTFIGNSQETPIEDRPSNGSCVIIPIPAINGFRAQLAFDNEGKWYVRSMGWDGIWTVWKTIAQ